MATSVQLRPTFFFFKWNVFLPANDQTMNDIDTSGAMPIYEKLGVTMINRPKMGIPFCYKYKHKQNYYHEYRREILWNINFILIYILSFFFTQRQTVVSASCSRKWRWPNIAPTLGEGPVFVGVVLMRCIFFFATLGPIAHGNYSTSFVFFYVFLWSSRFYLNQKGPITSMAVFGKFGLSFKTYNLLER